MVDTDLRDQFRSLVASRGGLYFKDHDIRNLDDAIISRMKSRGISSLPAYYTDVAMSEKKEDEFRELLNLLPIKHTHFSQDQSQLKSATSSPDAVKTRKKGADGYVVEIADFSLLTNSAIALMEKPQ